MSVFYLSGILRLLLRFDDRLLLVFFLRIGLHTGSIDDAGVVLERGWWRLISELGEVKPHLWI